MGLGEGEVKRPGSVSPVPDSSPIEPEGAGRRRSTLVRGFFILLVLVYVLLSHYHAPILMRVGRFLAVEHPPQRSDLIVCLSGRNVERGLAAADAFREGLAPAIFVPKEPVPDGYETLESRGVHYPKTGDLLVGLLTGLGVPQSAILTREAPASSTLAEALLVRDLARERGFRSIILITSPTHSRRAWLIFKKVVEDQDIRLLMLPSKYSGFRPEDWWKKAPYAREVILEYEKLAYYTLKYLF